MIRIAVFCATARGLRFIQKLADLVSPLELAVFSFPEDPVEPPFLDSIRNWTQQEGHRFFIVTQKNTEWKNYFETKEVDLAFVVSWRYKINRDIYTRPILGSFVFHDSLLPKYRGFSPTVWAIVNGESHTGATLFEIGEEIDCGDIIDQKQIPIGPDDTIADVMEGVTEAYLDILGKNAQSLLNGSAARIPQDHSLATYTCRRLPQDNLIHWNGTAGEIYNLIRAVTHPYAGAFTYLNGEKLRIWSAQQILEPRRYVVRAPGRVVEIYPGKGALVLTGNGSLMITKVQKETGDIVCAAEILNSLRQNLG